jgi:hypothetical protein
VVQRNRDGLSADQTARAVRRAVDVNRGLLGGLERVAGALVISNSLGKPPFSRESSTTALTYLFFQRFHTTIDGPEYRAALKLIPLRKRLYGNGRYWARTSDLLLVRREHVLRSSASGRQRAQRATIHTQLLRSAAVCRFHLASTGTPPYGARRLPRGSP